MEIRLFRPRAPLPRAAEEFWAGLARQAAANPD
jgi:hypothetical protein